MSSTDYNIKIGVDATKGERGVKSFTSTISDAMKALRAFDRAASGAFDRLRKLTATDTTKLARSMRGTAQAIEALNRVKLSRSLITNLQMLQQVLRNFRFNAATIKAVPDALNALNRIRIDSRLPTALNQIKAALVGFKGPPLAAVRNLNALIAGLGNANASRIDAAASALSRLNGLNLRVGRASLPNLSRQLAPLRGLQSQMSSLTSVANTLRAALAGVSSIAIGRSIYATGTAFVSLQRTLGAVASSSGEVRDQMDFLQSLTTRMPVSLEAAASSYGKFAVAARLSGVTVADTQKVFEGFSTAFAAMGVDAEKQRYGLLALEQIFSKGRVTAEEMRQQLGEHLPGAMQLLADAMDVPTSKLIKMMEAGEIGSDSLIKMAATLQSQFGPAVAAAMNTSAAQIVNFQNAWTELKRIIFDSGFNAGLGAMSRQMAEVLRSDDARRVAADVGQALGTVARAVGATVKVMLDNREAVATFFKVLGGYAAVAGTVTVLRLLASPLAILAPLAGAAATAFGVLKTAITAIATGKALTAVADIGKAFASLGGKIMLTVGAVTLFAAGLDAAFNNSRATNALIDSVGNTLKALAEKLTGFGADLAGGVSKAYEAAWKESEKYFKDIQNAELLNSDLMDRNAAREAANATAKLSALTEAEQSVWDEVNAIGKANSEYQKQLALLDAIAAKKGIDAAPWKAALTAQTLDSRNPAGALARDLRNDLAALTAKTGEQRALNEAQRDYNDLLAKGQNIGKAGLDALRQYHTAVARLNGEIGNGFERWTATVGDFNDRMQDAVKSGIEGLSDEITNFITGAETDFAGLARSILRTFVKISLDSLLKDLFGAIGMDPAKSATSSAEAALAKLAGIGENITTAMTNVYTTGLSINGLPVGAGSFAASPELPGNRERLRRLEESFAPSSAITRSALPDIPGTDVAGRLSDANVRFPIESAVGGLRGSYGPAGAFAVTAENLNLRGSLPVNVTIPAAATAARTAANNPFLDLIGRAEGTDRGRGYNETLAYGAFTGGNRNLTGMTLDQIDALQGQMLRHPANTFNSSALGRYQITQRTMRGLRSQMGLTGDELFDPAMQDSMALRLMARRGNNVAGLRNEWEGLRRVDPATIQNTYSASSLDPSVTGSIDALNAKLQTVGATAAQTAPAFDQLRAANQNMASASAMAGSSVATAGMNAQMAGPQFTTAGQSIATAGQNAATAGMQAQTATSGLGGFGQGISGLLGPLASAIPGLGQFGGMIMSLASSLFSGGGVGGGLLGGLFSEGGYANSPVARAALPLSAWAHAPHFSEGTPNTSGGIPAVLHDNEAVIPLSRGRKVPVEVSGNDNEPMYGAGAGSRRGRGGNVVNLNFHGVKDADTFRRSRREMEAWSASAGQRAMARNL